ncbi:MAG: tetratricopeptide repeat protein [Bacillota bacterium]
MRVVGGRIREIRAGLGLSQQQLAGSDLTRSFISLVEQGKAQPSLETLELLARRLGKPPEYFLARECGSDLEAIALLEKALRQCIESKDWAGGIEHAQGALRLAERIGNNRERESRLRSQLAYCQLNAKQFELAIELYERLIDEARDLDGISLLAETYFRKGVAHQMLEDFPGARRCYHAAIRLTEGKKSLMETRAAALINIGSTFGYMGEYDQAIHSYRQAIEEVLPEQYPEQYADALYGISLCYARLGLWGEATAYANRVQSFAERVSPEERVKSLYSSAMVHLQSGHPEKAAPMLETCLTAYRNSRQHRSQAWVLSAMVQCHLALGKPSEAKACITEALNLLDLNGSDDGVLRGILYREMAQVHSADGENDQAREMLRVSLHLLRRLRAFDEAQVTERLLDRI